MTITMTITKKKKRTRTSVAAAATAFLLGGALALAIPMSASAHVVLDVNTAAPGSYALLTFRVPTESATATTTSVTVTLPTDTPFVSVRTVPIPGWEAKVITTTLATPVKIGDTTITEAPTSIVWTATGAGLGESELGLFPVSLGPVPDTGQIAMPVDQGYSDGSVVAWADENAPTLFINDPVVVHHDDDGDGDEPPMATTEPSAPHESAGPDPTSVAGVVLGGGGFALGAIALAVSLIRRRPTA
ncbi:MAG: DUF1775 domain-containing protein [Pseudolysinimonas sp.]|uniref:YcnI family copper-binding membrane protein n=1 Tax=Pseudolysinimonas sp. TaxID=2680009 RepID=UPI0032661054